MAKVSEQIPQPKITLTLYLVNLRLQQWENFVATVRDPELCIRLIEHILIQVEAEKEREEAEPNANNLPKVLTRHAV
jgi:hypothetical protein